MSVMMQYFEWELEDDGKHWKRLAEDAEHLRKIGITSVWMPPATKATGSNDVGYGIYDYYDLGEFDQKGSIRTKYGTKEEYLEAIKSLQNHGIAAIADVVLNHKAGADETEVFPVYKVNPQNRQEVISEEYEIEGWTKFTFPGRKGKYSDYVWTWADFSGVDFDQRTGESGVFMIAGFEKGWADNENVDSEKGNYDYLMNADIDYKNKNTVNEILSGIEWYIKETGVNGFRLDAVKHIDDQFIIRATDKAREIGGDDFYLVGEYWKGNYDTVEDYLHETEFEMDLMDVRLHMNMSRASKSGNSFDMSKIFEGTLMANNDTEAVTFVDNHDSQPGEALESWVETWFKPLAYAIILLREHGLPCIFYGDYYGIKGGPEPFDGLQSELDILLALRQSHNNGNQHDYFDHQNCIGWTREGDENHTSPMAIMMTNGDAATKTMFVGPQNAGKKMIDAFNQEDETIITVGDDGNADFTCPPGGLSVWIEKGSI